MVYCGIDIGTTNVKGIVLSDEGKKLWAITNPAADVAARFSEEASETGGDLWYRQFCGVMDYFYSKGLLENQKVVCCVACQGGSFVIVDEQLHALSQVNLWTNMSAQKQVDKYLKHYSKDDFYRLSGWPPGAWMPVFKLKDVTFEQGQRVAFVSDYVYARLTGQLVTDITNAQMTGLANFECGCWDSNLLRWAGLYERDVASIKNKFEVLFEGISTKWGKMDLVTSLHDQYAAMNAVGLKAGKDVMLATGTAWVINFRSEKPVYNSSCTVHPGRDVVTGGYGNICTMGAVGAGFDELLRSVGLDYGKLDGLEGKLREMRIPTGALNFDLNDISNCGYGGLEAVSNYMLWSAAMVRYHLEAADLLDGLEDIIMTGGAGSSGAWPELVAGICGVDVKVVKSDELTAYGAAMAAASACGGDISQQLCDFAEIVVYKPQRTEEYKLWYEKFQKSFLEQNKGI